MSNSTVIKTELLIIVLNVMAKGHYVETVNEVEFDEKGEKKSRLKTIELIDKYERLNRSKGLTEKKPIYLILYLRY